MGIKYFVDEISKNSINYLKEYIKKKYNDFKSERYWKESIERACRISEDFNDSFVEYFLSCNSITKFYTLLVEKKNMDNIYFEFIITVATELCQYNRERQYAISFAIAILDNWFECFKMDTSVLKRELDVDLLDEIISDREKLYYSYFKLYNDKYGKDVIRIYYPRNGETWIDWDKDCSVDVKANLCKGMDLGFCRIGFSYRKIEGNENEICLKVAYLENGREVLRFENSEYDGDGENLLWIN